VTGTWTQRPRWTRSSRALRRLSLQSKQKPQVVKFLRGGSRKDNFFTKVIRLSAG
jgi:hypothetical protein